MNKIKCELSELVEVKNGSTPSTKRQDFYDGDIVWITPKDLSNNKSKYVYSSERKITKSGFDSCSTALLPVGSVLLSSRAPIGLLAICGVEVCTNQGFKNLVIKKDEISNKAKISNEYLYYWLKTKVKYIDSLGTGTTFKEVSKGVIQNLAIEIPKDVKEQQKIASVLSSLDSKIELNNRINAELEAMAKTLYDYWFVQFDFPDANGKPYKSSGGKMVWNEELKREIPARWTDGELNDIANITMGQSPLGESYNEKGDGMIFYQGCTDFGNRFPTVRKFTTQPTRYAKEGDILLSVRAPVGTLNIAKENCCIGRGLATLNSKDNCIAYLFGVLTNLKQIFDRRNVDGTTFGSITKDDLFTLKVVRPEVEVLKKYNEIINPVFQKQNKIEFENQKLTELRDWLLPMLMNGQVKVN